MILRERMSARPLPPGYICRKCGIPGHWIHDCLKGKPSTQSHLVLPTPQQLHERNQQLMLSGHGQPNVYFPSYGIPSIPPPMPLMPYFMMPLEGPSQSVIQVSFFFLFFFPFLLIILDKSY